MTLKRLLTLAATLAAASLAWGQISITQGSLMPVGASWEFRGMAFMTTFDVGLAGTDQTWTFGEYTFDYSSTNEVVDPASTPYSGDFPTANRAVMVGDAYYSFYRLTPAAAYALGSGGDGTATPYDEEALFVPFPCAYGSAWTSVMKTTTVIDTATTMTMVDSFIYSVDGWGTLHTQFGTFSVLRIFRRGFSTMEITGVPPMVSAFLNYLWYTSDGVVMLVVNSQEGETNPNFSTGFLAVSVLTTPAAQPRGPVVEKFAVGQNYPNPFNPATTLPVELERNARVTVKIYDETGRLVSQEEFDLPAGQHNLPVNGSSWATGTYFANVSAGADQQTVKMQLVK